MTKRPGKVILLLCFMAGLLLLPGSAYGAGGKATFFALQVDQFPQVTGYLDVRDGQGNFVRGLAAGQMRVVEDGRQLPVSALEVLHPGARFAIGVNPGRSFAIRDGDGTSRYDLIVEKLEAWAGERPAVSDEFSLFLADGAPVLNAARAGEIVQALQAYNADFRSEEPDLVVLNQAVEAAGVQTASPGGGRAVLFITSPLDPHFAIGLDAVASQALQRGVRISVWYVASPDSFYSRSYGLLQELALRTGGEMVAFSGIEPLPDPEHYLDPLREIYRLTYTSSINSAGEHPVFIEIDLPGEKIASSVQSYFMDIQPPTPILLDLPSAINRTNQAQSPTADPNLEPDFQTIGIVVEFRDGFPRQLAASFLYVNGEMVAENIQPPFDQFVWDLNTYLESGVHSVFVQVVDSLGLIGSSSEAVVEVSVEQPKISIWYILARNGPQLALVVVLFSGAVLLLVLVLGGKIRPRVFGRLQKADARPRGRKAFPETFSSEPLTQPVKGLAIPEESARRLPQWMNRLHLAQRQEASQASAYLTRLEEKGSGSVGRPIPLTNDEVRIGRDPLKVTMLLNDPSLEGLHARIRREDSSFRLSDTGSVAGTWVNYSPVSTEGTMLEHGDIVHIGRVGFRFTLREPERVRKPAVIPKEPGK
jgi:hypothetical protein